jgi:DNA helicase II / ATP-dependent DNA helicase PcrA
MPKVITPREALEKRLKAAAKPPDDNTPHIGILALAGTGKTTTLVEGIKLIRGEKSTMQPSHQQRAVWDCMTLNRQQVRTVCVTSFGDAIVKELKARVPRWCKTQTLHSIGLRAISSAFSMEARNLTNPRRAFNHVAECMGVSLASLQSSRNSLLHGAVKLAGLCKLNLLPLDIEDDADRVAVARLLEEMVDTYELDINKHDKDDLFRIMPMMLAKAKDVQGDLCVDYNDMVWLPVALGLEVFKHDLLLIDEAQDLNRAQQALARMSGSRLVVCGDPRQAIYGFAGADTDSMPRMVDELSRTKRGCRVFPLTISRRCSKAVVQAASKYVPELEAHADNHNGIVYDVDERDALEVIQGACMAFAESSCLIVCRCNAPLVGLRRALNRMGLPARIVGRDNGGLLIELVERLAIKGRSGTRLHVNDLMTILNGWESSKVDKERKGLNRYPVIAGIRDRAESIRQFAQGCHSAEDVLSNIRTAFSDKAAGVLRLATIHKAKGLEASDVFFLQTPGAECPHPRAATDWQKEQENNLCYVAITRAMSNLVFIRRQPMENEL